MIDKEHQYFLAESTKTLNLADDQRCEEDGDNLWLGCSTVSKQGRLCEVKSQNCTNTERQWLNSTQKTIELPPCPGKYPCFTVADLTKDDRFNRLPFVTGAPFFRFYAGTPLTTKKGVNIGSLFIIDDKPQSSLSADQEEFLGTIATTVMKHMEINSEAEERKRAMRMSRGLNAFVEGKSHFDLEDYIFDTSVLNSRHKLERHEIRQGKPHSSDSQEIPIGSDHLPTKTEFSSNTTPSEDLDDSQDEAEDVAARGGDDLDQRSTFVRAAKLLRESLDLRGQGGVVFLDTAIGFRGGEDSSYDNSAASNDNQTTKDVDEDRLSLPDESTKVVFRHSSFGGALEDHYHNKRADVISFSTSEGAVSPATKTSGTDSFSPLSEDLLQSFLQRYPRGKLWSFDEDGSLSSSEEDNALPRDRHKILDSRSNRSKTKRMEADLLQMHFPNVRQLLFAPLWDSSTARWFSGCFVWGTSPRQVFSEEAELSFLIAFGNSVMAEVSRLASISADRQKGDFIGSISHELRSPLHGILASAEFLSETDIDNFQNSLVSTVNSCSRTLLDTINHILDFSKINTFERNWRNVRKPRLSTSNNSTTSSRIAAKQTMQKEAPPLMNIYAVTDVAAVTEEVVEGVYAGQVYQDINSAEFVDFSSDEKGGRLNRSGNRSSLVESGGQQLDPKEIEVVLDIAHDDYTFTTQPGALRRVIMNVLGNALKYTQKGMIVVKIALDSLDSDAGMEEENERMLEIKITDTGKGISSKYLRTSLYTRMSHFYHVIFGRLAKICSAFCQEDTLASGTGLGLSIVRSIVNMLGGSIDIRSQVGQGTEVKIRLPLKRVPRFDTPMSTPSTGNSIERPYDDSISALQAEYPGKSVALFGFDTKMQATLQSTNTAQVLKVYIEQWFGLAALSASPGLVVSDIVIVDEEDLVALWQPNSGGRPTIVLSSNSSRFKKAHTNDFGAFEFVSKPFGPYKLAKAIRICLDKAKAISDGLAPAASLLRGASPAESDADTVIPDFEEMTLQTENAPTIVPFSVVVTAANSTNAQMAIESTSASASSDHQTKNSRDDFPFPSQEDERTGPTSSERLRIDLTRRDSRRPKLGQRVTEPYINKTTFPYTSPISKTGEMVAVEPSTTPEPAQQSPTQTTKGLSLPENSATSDPEKTQMRPPRLLLVDDNKINLRLLETFMQKRKYTFVDSAENGQLAVQAAEKHEEGYDIIFMGRKLKE